MNIKVSPFGQGVGMINPDPDGVVIGTPSINPFLTGIASRGRDPFEF